MHLESLQVHNVRNIQSAQLALSPQFNFIIGENGSGKTSLLEAIHILSSGHSFRSREVSKVIYHDANDLVVSGALIASADHVTKVGIQRTRDGATTIKINGEKQNRTSVLSKTLPSLSIDAKSFEFVEGGPAVRRMVLDWGMFHVEHSYLALMQNYRKVLFQKSSLFKQRDRNLSDQLQYWNRELDKYGSDIDQQRESYVQTLQDRSRKIFKDIFNIDEEVVIDYSPGWNKEKYDSLNTCLSENREQEIQRKSCLWGPHRADLKILYQGTLAKEICSRGQKKLVLYGVRLAQIAHIKEKLGLTPIVLLDDLPAELDQQNQNRVVDYLIELGCQCLVTSIEKNHLLERLSEKSIPHKMFHVEHGTIK